MAITIVNQSVAGIRYSIFGGSASGISGGGSGTGSGGGSGSGSGVIASGTIPASGTASGIAVSGSPSYTVVFNWVQSPSYVVSASGVVTIQTSAKK
jgi:hypothetical protein